jgi:glycosyltransferase involved in cell wall biosynthesis
MTGMTTYAAAAAYPEIVPVPADVARPFWSIMIPAYNCAEYLRGTLRSVLAEIPADRTVQIEVIDDCSTRDDPETVVAECGDPRVRFFRQASNVGAQANFTTCIQRAHGEWVHILHGDDLVAPGFYDTLETALRAHPDAGAAFCRTINIDASGARIDLSEPEADQPGIHPDLIGRLGVRNLIMFPSMVVKRETYERLGGFHPALFHAADWDMWKRVALAGPVWYEPTPLAMYRLHAQSDTSALMRSGANIADARTAIEVARHYLPAAICEDVTRKARLYHGLYALELAAEMVTRNSWRSAGAQVREAFRCSTSPTLLWAVTRLAGRTLATQISRSLSSRRCFLN